MSPRVQRQVVGAREGAVALRTSERLLPGVLPVVPRQLVRPRELPVAALPGALVRLLACVKANHSVRLMVGRSGCRAANHNKSHAPALCIEQHNGPGQYNHTKQDNAVVGS